MAASGNMLTLLGSAGVALGVMVFLRKLFRRKVSLQGKIVLITGASSGLGEACAHLFYKAGAKLILCARRTRELERVKRDLEQLKTNATVFEPKVLQLDLTEFDSLPSKVQTAVGFHGRIDILLNNGGISSRGSVLETVLEVYQKVMAVNYFGTVALTKEGVGETKKRIWFTSHPSEKLGTIDTDSKMNDGETFKFVVTRDTVGKNKIKPRGVQVVESKKGTSIAAVLPYMIKEKSGHILTVSSIQGHIGIPYRSSYGASKHAIQAFCDTLRAEIAEHNIEVSVYSPSYICTSLSINALTEAGQQSGAMEQNLASGMSPEYAAKGIMQCITHGQQDVLVGPLVHRMAVYARLLLPAIFFKVMAGRATKESRQDRKYN